MYELEYEQLNINPESEVKIGETNTQPRLRKLTDKGREQFCTIRDKYLGNVKKAWAEVEGHLKLIDPNVASPDVLNLRSVERVLGRRYDAYREVALDYIAFLTNTRAAEGVEEMKQYKGVHEARKTMVEEAMLRIDQEIQVKLEEATVRSTSVKSRHPSRSSASHSRDSLAEVKVKAEKARESVEFMKREAKIRKHQALIEENQRVSSIHIERQKKDLETDLLLLKQEKDVALAEVELKVIQEACSDAQSEFDRATLGLPVEDRNQRTKCFVEDINTRDTEITQEGNPLTQTIIPPTYLQQPTGHISGNVQLNPAATAFIPSTTIAVGSHNERHKFGDAAITFEVTRFLLRKELLFSRLTKYDDRPESYALWKAGFRNIMQELDVNPSEELDLLIKWLGNESVNHAHSLRAANVHDPAKGVAQIWERLDERFGSPEMVESSLKAKLNAFPKLSNKDSKRLYELSDIVAEIESTKGNEKYRSLLAYYDSSSGVIPIVNKLPYSLQERWIGHASKYKRDHRVSFPPFSVFSNFLREVSVVRNDPSFAHDIGNDKGQRDSVPKKRPQEFVRSVKKTEVNDQSKPSERNLNGIDPKLQCPVHNMNHPLNQCRKFRTKSLEDRKRLLREFHICYKCCASTGHIAKACKETIRCEECGSGRHSTAMHLSPQSKVFKEKIGGEFSAGSNDDNVETVNTSCTQICGKNFQGKSCAKTLLVTVYPTGNPEKSKKMYAILDDQSNASLARPDFFDLFAISGNEVSYDLSSCAGKIQARGRTASGYVIAGLDDTTVMELPTLLECQEIPQSKEEIATPEVAWYHPHLRDIAALIPPLNTDVKVQLLIGRDLLEAHHVLDQRIGPRNSPYAQRLPLGWVVIGETCLNGVHKPELINVNKTHLLKTGRVTTFEPCPYNLSVRRQSERGHFECCEDFGTSVFEKTAEDDQRGMSVEDRQFLHIMKETIHKNSKGNWEVPLPFREPRPRLPNNYSNALKRARMLDKALKKDEKKRQHMLTFMQAILDNGHAERAPAVSSEEESWYLPVFGVYHPRKPGQIRGVFDSSAEQDGLSLNSVLLRGPPLTSSLLGVLLRFRKEPIAIMADLQQMFYCFSVNEEHRNFLKFLWYEDNDMNRDLVSYRMTVHAFGNSPSPAIATYALRNTVLEIDEEGNQDVIDYVNRNFYVDDGLAALPTPKEAIDLLKKTQEVLKNGANLRLHKIASNCSEVMEAFPIEDRAKEIRDLNLEMDTLPVQHSLGVTWDLTTDCFSFHVNGQSKPFTKRGILSTINGIFDPMGIIAPVIIRGRILMRDLMTGTIGWDQLLPDDLQGDWDEWRQSLEHLHGLSVPRAYTVDSLLAATTREIHIFADASEKAIAAVGYIRTVNMDGDIQVGFLLGKAKVAPSHGHTIPRLELCAAVLAVEIAEFVLEQLDIGINGVQMYTDSKIVLGYIQNEVRRFSVYVANRVVRIRKVTKPEQWRYVATNRNPADLGTRAVLAKDIGTSSWLMGPSFLLQQVEIEEQQDGEEVCDDPEVVQTAVVLSSKVLKNPSLGTHRFERFSSFTTLVKAIVRLRHIATRYHKDDDRETYTYIELYEQAKQQILKEVQKEVYSEELRCMEEHKSLPRNSAILDLDPFLDKEGLIRVGGRLRRANINLEGKHPIIIPGKQHVATLLVRLYHEAIKHQGRHFTEGAVRAAGFWIVGGRRLISSYIHRCVTCRKLRGKQLCQKMADLPEDRLSPSPPFTHVGVDAFGPWSIVTRRTRGGQANSKRWAVLFTCLSTRAIHIEVIEEMSSSGFINALRRFVAIRGEVKEFRSDRGTNFVGATSALQMDTVNVEDGPIKGFMAKNGALWIFNPPHSSHMGGVWERMIGVVRRILDAMLKDVSTKDLTHDVLVTFMAEVSAIVNSRPLVPVSSDPDSPFVLSPSMLLTQKTGQCKTAFHGDLKDMYRAQWKHVQVLASIFWNRWKHEYLTTLQTRRKWKTECVNLRKGDIVILVDKDVSRNEWPLGIIEEALPGHDGKVRKAAVKVVKDAKTTTYIRPITEIVPLLSE